MKTEFKVTLILGIALTALFTGCTSTEPKETTTTSIVPTETTTTILPTISREEAIKIANEEFEGEITSVQIIDNVWLIRMELSNPIPIPNSNRNTDLIVISVDSSRNVKAITKEREIIK